MSASNNNPHNRRGLGMQRHYTPAHAGGSIDAQRTANPDPTVAPQAIANNQSGLAMQQRSMPIQQGTLPVGGRGADRQVTQ